MEKYLIEKGGNCFIKCRIQPSASKTGIIGLYGDSIKISVKAPPVNGKANKALCKFIAKKINLPKSRISIVKGEKSKHKTLKCSQINANKLLKLLS